jgi:hypothetical protein
MAATPEDRKVESDGSVKAGQPLVGNAASDDYFEDGDISRIRPGSAQPWRFRATEAMVAEEPSPAH